MKENIILVGGGGHCRSCIDVIEQQGRYAIYGIIDGKENIGQEVCGYKMIGSDQDIPHYMTECPNFIVTVGQVKGGSRRKDLFEMLKVHKANVPVIISPLARVSPDAQLGEGTIIMHHALVNRRAVIGCNAIVNTKALIEHDVRLGDHVCVSTGAIINGECDIGHHVFIGSGSVVNQCVSVVDGTVLGSGAVVVRDIVQPGTYVGCPARRLRV
ncbi:MAG: acetyltransferase [Candidatus Omnitrophica bacterium]|nr:acetyltransferase [Candidatus Omnitrophota bacterium]